MNKKRFEYHKFDGTVNDDLTGKKYHHYNMAGICDLLNQMTDKNDELAEKYINTLVEKQKLERALVWLLMKYKELSDEI